MASSSLQMVLRVHPVLAPAGRMDQLQRVAHHVPVQEALRLVVPGRRARQQRLVLQVLVAPVLAVPEAHAPVAHQAVLVVGR
jgi:hypothetical protein